MAVFKALRVLGGVVMAGGVGLSVVRIVALLQAQAFDQVAGAGLIGLAGLVAGGVLLWGGFVLEPARETAEAPARSLLLLRRRQRAAPPRTEGGGGGCLGILGWLAVLGGGGWVALTIMAMGLDAPESALTLVFAAPGGIVALVGLVMVAVGALRRNG